MEYTEWRHNAAETTEKWVLKTVEKILDDASGSSRLTSTQLDDLKDCWKILCKLTPGEKMLAK